jgi:hypothetical protein
MKRKLIKKFYFLGVFDDKSLKIRTFKSSIILVLHKKDRIFLQIVNKSNKISTNTWLTCLFQLGLMSLNWGFIMKFKV